MKRKPTFLEAVNTLFITFGVILIGIVFLKVDAHIPLFVGTLICIGFAFYLRFPWSDIEKGIFDGIKSAIVPMLLIMLIGLVISGWIASGTVPYLIYWGLKVLSPSWFLTSAAVICCVMSMSIGSSWTTIGTLGVALMGVGSGLGVPAAMTAGAVATGAFFGDKQSPLSDTTNFAPAVCGTNLYEHIRSMLYTTLPTLLIGLAIYTFLGFKYSSGVFDRTGMDLIITTIENSYNLTPFLLIPLAILIFMILKKVPALLAMMTAAVLGLIFTMIFQGGTLAAGMKILHYGFVSQTGVETVDTLLSRGGLHSMMWTISLIFIALSLAGVLQKTGTLAVVLEKLAGFVKNAFGLISTTVWATAAMNFLTGEVFMPMLLSARVFLPAFDRQRLDRKVLSRSIEDGGTIIAPMVPWGMCGVFTAVTLGVPTLEYVPYYFLGLLNPIVSMTIAALGFGVFRTTGERAMETENEALAENEA